MTTATPARAEVGEKPLAFARYEDRAFYTWLGAAILPAVRDHAIARELARHEGERRRRVDDLMSASCDAAV